MVLSEHAPAGLFRGPAAYAAISPWRPGWAIVAMVVIVTVSILAAVLFIGAAPMGMLGPRETGSHETGALVTLLVWQVVAIVLTVLACTLFGGNPRDVLALRAPAGSAGVYVRALVLLLVMQFVVSAVQYYVVPGDTFADLRPFVNIVGGPDWVFALLVVGIGAPLSEELLFRGFLMSALARSRLGFAGAAFVSTALWTALHAGYSATGIIEVFLIGLFLSWLLWRTGSLRVPIFCHALYNSLVVLILRHVPLPA